MAAGGRPFQLAPKNHANFSITAHTRHSRMSHNFGAGHAELVCRACGMKREWAYAPCPAVMSAFSSSAAAAAAAAAVGTTAAPVAQEQSSVATVAVAVAIPVNNTAPPALPGSFRAAHEALAQLAKAVPPPSAEQQAIIEAVKRGSSLIVNSGAPD